MPYRLGVDLGTSFTAAAVTDGSEPTVIGLGNRALQIPSVLFLQPDGTFLVGEAAEQRGLTEPDRLAREFKRRIGDHVPIMVAGAPFSPQALTAHLLRWVVDAATERMGQPPSEVVLTHPANWGPFQLELLDQVAAMAGITSTRRCTEPEAAAAQYAAQTRVSPGDRIAVYDLGGGTFDACVLEKTDTGFHALGTPEGVEHLGGADFDEALLRHVLTTLNPTNTPLNPDDPKVTAGLARLRRNCLEAKEALSTAVDTLVPVALPGLSTTVRVTRAEFEQMIRPALTETITAITRALRNAHVEPAHLHSILLIGGSSHIPLVSQMLNQEFPVPTALHPHPTHDTALGSLRVGHDEADGSTATPPAPVTPAALPPVAAEPAAATAAAVGPPLAALGPDGGGAGGDGTPPPGGEGAAAAGLPGGSPAPAVGASTRPPGGLVRVLAVVVAAVLLGIGAGVFITQRDKG
ncbi:MAG TPA: Hsp70 family protein, partial [Propionibacteriaceae bacterium]|nr:Hsp70 family protein [Propionibacteriaceae bacterium]